MILTDGIRRGCALKKVQYILELAYNLVSVSRVVEARKTVHFGDLTSEFRKEEDEIIFLSTKQGSLYYLNFSRSSQETVNVAQMENLERL